jgi:2-amino-4-hydroxy-6-hydroxymethyldihydropteridine diphosphokinase
MSADWVTAFVGLGSNLDQPVSQVQDAFSELDALPDTRLLGRSPLYRSAPLGPPGQPDYVNAAAMLETRLTPHALLDLLQGIERRHGRLRGERWGPRSLDLDLLLFADRRIDSRRLQVPHPEISRRPFVLIPLYDIAPDLSLPGVGPLSTLAQDASRAGLWRLSECADG